MKTHYRRVLFVAPDDKGLAVIPEQDAISAMGFEVRTLQGCVDDNRLFDAVRMGGFDVLHFACDGNWNGLQLTGSVLTFGGLQQVVRQSGASLVFLNACRTSALVQQLVTGGLPAGIATFREIEDHIAKQTGQIYYAMLAKQDDAQRAFLAACDPSVYGFFANGGYSAMLLEPVNERIERLERLVWRVVWAMMLGFAGTVVVDVLMHI